MSSPNFSQSNRFVALCVMAFALFLSGCVFSGSSSSSSTSAYFGPSVSSAKSKAKAAAKNTRAAKKQFDALRTEISKLDRQIARDIRRLKRKKVSSRSRAKFETRIKRNRKALRLAKRKLRKTQRAYTRAVSAERRAVRTVATAQRRRASEERRLALADKRKADRRARASASTSRSGSFSLFSRSDSALKNVKDYGARVDGGFQIAAIPVKKVNKRLLRQQVRYSSRHKVGTLVVDPNSKFLYLIQSGGKAMRYGIGVGKAGFEWSGSAHIGWKQEWPKWTPPEEMIQRRPDLRKWSADNGGMPGGPTNPLGARALYLMQGGVDTLYRLHGTPEWDSIGTAASSGCIRLMNQDIIDLYKRVPHGARVVVL